MAVEKQLLINVSPLETRVALLENASMAELFIERHHEQGMVGKVYKGIVSRVLPGMNSAFIDIGADKAAFLFGGDVLPPLSEREQAGADGDLQKKWEKRPIEQSLRDGQEIIVQVTKEPLGTKGPRVSMYLALPGRFLVLMPFFAHCGISRRIEAESERERLKSLVLELLPPGLGVIIRTAAMDVEATALQSDLQYLLKSWTELTRGVGVARPPSLLYQDLDLAQKLTRDLFCPQMTQILVDDHTSYLQLQSFLELTMPAANERLSLHAESTPLFDLYGVEVDIARALAARVELPSGGYLIIEQTEALTSFDINTGKFVGKANVRHTILKTNLEAAKRVVEQLRIRNIGGIIIVDFIDMEDAKDRDLVYQTLQDELKADRARTNVLRISELGLVQMTRKRTSESLERKLLEPCHYCSGKGMVKSAETEAYDLLRELQRMQLQASKRAAPDTKKAFKVKVRPDIQRWLSDHCEQALQEVCSEAEVFFEKTALSKELLREAPYEVTSVY